MNAAHTSVTGPEIDGDARPMVGLQRALTNLLELQTQAKHLHWNVVGTGFVALHQLLDEVAATAASSADDVAERMRALGGEPSGRTNDTAMTTTLRPAERGLQPAPAAAAHIIEGLQVVARSLTECRARVDADDDPVSADIINGVVLALDKHRWLIAAENWH